MDGGNKPLHAGLRQRTAAEMGVSTTYCPPAKLQVGNLMGSAVTDAVWLRQEGQLAITKGTSCGSSRRLGQGSLHSLPLGWERCLMQFTNKQSRATWPTEGQLLPGNSWQRPGRLGERRPGP